MKSRVFLKILRQLSKVGNDDQTFFFVWGGRWNRSRKTDDNRPELGKGERESFLFFFCFGGIQDLNDDTHPGFSRVEKKVTPEGHPALLYLMTTK